MTDQVPRNHGAPGPIPNEGVPGRDPREQLASAVSEIAAKLPVEQAALLALTRFAAERAALERLCDPAWANLGAGACTPAEAQRLFDLARSRHGGLPGAITADPE